MIKGIIFDLDGTLLNTIVDITNSVNAVLEDYGYGAYSVKEIMTMVGHGFKEMLRKALPPKTSEEQLMEAVEKFTYYYGQYYSDNSKPFDGIVDMLKELQKRGIKIAINTNKEEGSARVLVKENFADIEFFDIKGQKENRPTKPDPFCANIIADEMGFEKNEILFVGDSSTDIKTGTALGVSTIGVTWGYREKEELLKAGATYVINEPKAIIDIISK